MIALFILIYYEWIDKVDEYIYNKVKDELLS